MKSDLSKVDVVGLTRDEGVGGTHGVLQLNHLLNRIPLSLYVQRKPAKGPEGL